MSKKQFVFHLKRLGIQVGISSIWFIGMLLVYRYDFIQYHFIDSHFKRVTASIEQHFGQRTFYVTVLIDQLKLLLIPAFLSIGYLTYSFFKKKEGKIYDSAGRIFCTLVCVSQPDEDKNRVVYLSRPSPIRPPCGLPARASQKESNSTRFCRDTSRSLFILCLSPLLTLSLLNLSQTLKTISLLRWMQRRIIVQSCLFSSGSDTRTSYQTLKSMDLVISTTTWWGNHPSIAYYADINTTYLYDVKEAIDALSKLKNNNCMLIERNDLSLFILTQSVQNIVNKTKLIFFLNLDLRK